MRNYVGVDLDSESNQQPPNLSALRRVAAIWQHVVRRRGRRAEQRSMVTWPVRGRDGAGMIHLCRWIGNSDGRDTMQIACLVRDKTRGIGPAIPLSTEIVNCIRCLGTIVYD